MTSYFSLIGIIFSSTSWGFINFGRCLMSYLLCSRCLLCMCVIAFGCCVISVINRAMSTRLVTAISRPALSQRVRYLIIDRITQPCLPVSPPVWSNSCTDLTEWHQWCHDSCEETSRWLSLAHATAAVHRRVHWPAAVYRHQWSVTWVMTAAWQRRFTGWCQKTSSMISHWTMTPGSSRASIWLTAHQKPTWLQQLDTCSRW